MDVEGRINNNVHHGGGNNMKNKWSKRKVLFVVRHKDQTISKTY